MGKGELLSELGATLDRAKEILETLSIEPGKAGGLPDAGERFEELEGQIFGLKIQ